MSSSDMEQSVRAPTWRLCHECGIDHWGSTIVSAADQVSLHILLDFMLSRFWIIILSRTQNLLCSDSFVPGRTCAMQNLGAARELEFGAPKLWHDWWIDWFVASFKIKMGILMKGRYHLARKYFEECSLRIRNKVDFYISTDLIYLVGGWTCAREDVLWCLMMSFWDHKQNIVLKTLGMDSYVLMTWSRNQFASSIII